MQFFLLLFNAVLLVGSPLRLSVPRAILKEFAADHPVNAAE